MRHLFLLFVLLWSVVPLTALEPEQDGYIRMGGSMAEPVFQTATRRFVPSDSTMPDVLLVGVVHIADASYYSALQSVLDSCGRVLYESASRPTFVKMPHVTDTEKIARTREKLHELADLSVIHHRFFGLFPDSSRTLRRNLIRARQSFQIGYLRDAAIDDWGNPIRFESTAGSGLRLSSSADSSLIVEVTRDSARDASQEPTLHQQLAAALILSCQTERIRYDRPHFEHCDIAFAELMADTQNKSVQPENLRALVDGTSDLAKFASLAMFALSQSPSLGERVKYQLFNTLSRLDMEKPILGNWEGMIIHQRNAAVMKRLGEIKRSEAETVGIFYGAAHFYDIEKQLLKQGYHLREIQWFDAVAVKPESIEE